MPKAKGVYNFSAGPGLLPEPVFDQISEDLYGWQGSQISVLEMSHRGEQFGQILKDATESLNELLDIPEGYKAIFLQGGARLQFSMIPMNFLKGSCHYIITGVWSELAAREAEILGHTSRQDIRRGSDPVSLIDPSDWQIDSQASYCHVTSNETINGIEHFVLPAVKTPIVSDVSSTLLSRPFDLKPYHLVYACAQKNMGIAGVTIVILKEDWLEKRNGNLSSMLDYENHLSAQSLYNTSPTFSIYVSSLLFKWILEEGGLDEMARRNDRKSKKLYDYIDQSDFYFNKVDRSCRSWTNVVFTLGAKELENQFISFARRAGIINIKGHRLVGGMRASLYNAMSEEGVDKLIEVMDDFYKKSR